jgi:4-hydroxy-tetrahydrodipicolinate synthase
MTVSAADAKEWARATVTGQWVCPLGAVTETDELDEEGLRAGVRHSLKMQIGGLAFSSLMEPWSSTHEERRRGLEVFVDEVGGRVPVYVNVTDHSIKETIALGRHALAQPGDIIALVECPYEHAKSEELIVAFFEYVCERLEGPVALYNTPHSGWILPPQLVARLASIRNVCAIKNAINNPTHTAMLFKLLGDEIVISDPSEKNYLLNIIANGQKVVFSTTATHLMQSPTWQPIEEYATLARAGKLDEAWDVYHQLEPLRAVWEGIYSVLWDPNHPQHPIAYTKYWQDLMGMPAGPPRPPIRPLTEDGKRAFRQRLRASGLMERLGVDLGAGDWSRDLAVAAHA